MSFASKVRDELLTVIPRTKPCRIAELSAFCMMLGRFRETENGHTFLLETEQEGLCRKYFTLLRKTISIGNHENPLRGEAAEKLVKALKLPFGISNEQIPDIWETDKRLLQHDGCREAFLRGVFLAAGTMSDPEKAYHLEIVCKSEPQAQQVRAAMERPSVFPKIVERKGSEVVYIKESDQIIETLGVMGAHLSLMEMENVRILKDMRNSVNRRVNCETANISKTVDAAVRQLEDIRYIEDTCGLSALPKGLEEIARIRMSHPQLSLLELGMLLDPPVGKSGVNHRMRRISEFAQDLRNRRQITCTF